MKKRTKMIALLMVLAFALTGVGYAAWTDTLYINGNVKTGSLDVDYVSGCLFGATICPAIVADQYVTKSIEYIDDNTCKVTIGNLYPGAKVWFDVAQKNKGSIPVKFDKATITFSGNTELVPYLQARGSYVADTNGGSILDGFASGIFLGGGSIYNPTFGSLANLGTAMTSALQGKVFQPGGWICFADEEQNGDEPSCIYVKLADNAPNEVQGKEITFTITMDWKQFNQ